MLAVRFFVIISIAHRAIAMSDLHACPPGFYSQWQTVDIVSTCTDKMFVNDFASMALFCARTLKCPCFVWTNVPTQRTYFVLTVGCWTNFERPALCQNLLQQRDDHGRRGGFERGGSNLFQRPNVWPNTPVTIFTLLVYVYIHSDKNII